MTGRSITAVVFGVVVATVGLVLVLGAIGPLTEYRDADGFYMGDPFTFERQSYGIVSGDIEILKGRYPDLAADSLLMFLMSDPVDVRMQGTASGTADVLFLGIAPTAAADAYLSGVAHAEIARLERHQESHQIENVRYTTHEGTSPPGPPSTETFWAASVEGEGQQTLDWTIEPGEWTLVIMNADAASGVNAQLAFGATVSNIAPIAWTMVTAGLIALMSGGSLMFYGLRRRGRDSASPPAEAPDEHSSPQPESLEQQPTAKS